MRGDHILTRSDMPQHSDVPVAGLLKIAALSSGIDSKEGAVRS